MSINEESVVKKALSENEYSGLSKTIVKKIDRYVEKKFSQYLVAKATYETTNTKTVQENEELKKKVEEQEEQINLLRTNFESAQHNLKQLENQIEELQNDLRKSNELRYKAENETIEMKSLRDAALQELNGLKVMMERRNIEVESLQSELKSMIELYEKANKSKIDAVLQLQDIEMTKQNLDFREKHMENERNMLNNQIRSKNEEINNLMKQLSSTQKESNYRTMDLKTKLEMKIGELEQANNEIANLSEKNNELSKKCQELVDRLKEQIDNENRNRESFAQELQAQIRLSNLYKEGNEDSRQKIEKLTEGIKELHKVIAEITDKYGELETKYNEEKDEYSDTLDRKNECIDLLKQEINELKELVQKTKDERLDEVLEALAPKAKATCQLIKSGMSFNQFFKLYTQSCEKVIVLETEKRRLENCIEQMVNEMQNHVPIINKQREDYENAMENITLLTKQNEEYLNELQTLKNERIIMKKELKHFKRENEKLTQIQEDLSRQVVYLIKLYDPNTNQSMSMNDDDNNGLCNDSSDVISQHLITFKNVEELQMNNEKLIALVRDLTKKQEEAEMISPETINELKTELEASKKNQEELVVAQERHSQTLQIIKNQRDTYKSLYLNEMNKRNISQMEKNEILSQISEVIDNEQEFGLIQDCLSQNVIQNKNTVAASINDEKIKELERKLSESNEIIKALKDDFASSMKEQQTNEKMSLEQLEKKNKEYGEMIEKVTKLSSMLEYKDEQIKVCKLNNDTFKKQIQALQRKNEVYNNAIAQHEANIKRLTEEMLFANSKLSDAEVEIKNLRIENSIMKEMEKNFLREQESYLQTQHSNNLFLTNIDAIKASIERIEAEGKVRLENLLADSVRECSGLRRRLQEEQEKFREITKTLEIKANDFERQFREERELTEKLRNDINSMQNELDLKQRSINDLNNKLKMTIYQTNDPINEQITQLKKELTNVKLENEELSKKLQMTREEAKQYFDVSENSEQQLKIINDLYTDYKTKAEEKQKENADTIELLNKKITDLEKKISMSSSEHLEKNVLLTKQLEEVTAQRNSLKDELETLKIEFEVAREQIMSLNEQVEEKSNMYQQEIMNHTADIQQLNTVKEELHKLLSEKEEMQMKTENAVKHCEIIKTECDKREKMLEREKEDYARRVEELEKLKTTLLDQINELGTKLAVSHASETSLDLSFTSPQSIDDMQLENEKFSQLLDVMKFLRKEKDITFSQLDILQCENSRLKSQYELLKRDYENVKNELDSIRNKESANIITLAKHEEILRKVDTLNAITDSNRILRQERDEFSAKILTLTDRVQQLEEELAPLQNKNAELEAQINKFQDEIAAARVEAQKWRARANSLVERSTKATPDEWRRLQNERENLVKMLQAEKEKGKKSEDLKVKFEAQCQALQKNMQNYLEQNKKYSNEANEMKQQQTKIMNELIEVKESNVRLNEENSKVREELEAKSKEHNDLCEKYVKVRNLAKKFKVEKDEFKDKEEKAVAALSETQEENRREINDKIANMKKEHTNKINELTKEINSYKEDIEKVKLDNNKRFEHSQQLLRTYKVKINELSETIINLEKQNNDLVIEKQMETDRLTKEVEHLRQQIKLFQSSSSGSTTSGDSKPPDSGNLLKLKDGKPTNPPTANVKPMAGTSSQKNRRDTPFASVRPLAQIGRTSPFFKSLQIGKPTLAVTGNHPVAPAIPHALVPPTVSTTAGNNNANMNEYQLPSSPTSSHTDYMPATSSAGSSTNILAVQPTIGGNLISSQNLGQTTTSSTTNCDESPSTAAESSGQEMDSEAVVGGRTQQPTNIVQPQPAIALVLPQPIQIQQQPSSQSGCSTESESTSTTTAQASSVGSTKAAAVSQQHTTSTVAPATAVVTANNHQATSSSSNTVTTTQATASGSSESENNISGTSTGNGQSVVGGSGTSSGSLKRKCVSEEDNSTSTSSQLDKLSSGQSQSNKRTKLVQGNTVTSEGASMVYQGVSESGIEVEYQVPTSSQREDQDDDVICVDSDDDDEDEDGENGEEEEEDNSEGDSGEDVDDEDADDDEEDGEVEGEEMEGNEEEGGDEDPDDGSGQLDDPDDEGGRHDREKRPQRGQKRSQRQMNEDEADDDVDDDNLIVIQDSENENNLSNQRESDEMMTDEQKSNAVVAGSSTSNEVDPLSGPTHSSPKTQNNEANVNDTSGGATTTNQGASQSQTISSGTGSSTSSSSNGSVLSK